MCVCVCYTTKVLKSSLILHKSGINMFYIIAKTNYNKTLKNNLLLRLALMNFRMLKMPYSSFPVIFECFEDCKGLSEQTEIKGQTGANYTSLALFSHLK